MGFFPTPKGNAGHLFSLSALMSPTQSVPFRWAQAQSLGGGFRVEIMHAFYHAVKCRSSSWDSAHKARPPHLHQSPSSLNSVFSPAFLSQNEE